jgi:hypothetical protein
MAGTLTVAVVAVAIYGLGTVGSLVRPSPWPQSSAVAEIRRDATGWREFGALLSAYPEPVFALDYSIASQIRYYGGLSAYTAWGQYLIWGLPSFKDSTMVGLDYLPDGLVTRRLQDAYQTVTGPRHYTFEEQGAAKEAWVWQASGLRLDEEAFLQEFDFLTLLEASQ